MDEPRLSIVVPVYNGRKYIQDTLESLQQLEGLFSCELIFQNAQSTDGTTEVLDTFCQNRANRFHYNEPDEGQSDAINRGVSRSSCKWVTWLCADDILLPAVLTALDRAEAVKAEIVYGDVVFLHGSTLSTAVGTESYQTGILAKRHLVIQQPGTCILRQSWDEFHGVRNHLNWAMDYDLFLRMESVGKAFYREKDFVAVIRIHEDAKTSSGSVKRMFELWGMIWQSHKRVPKYFRIHPYLVYGFEFIIKLCEERRRERQFPPKFLLQLFHKLFWIIASPNEEKQIKQRFNEQSNELRSRLDKVLERSTFEP